MAGAEREGGAPDVSVVVVNYATQEDVAACLAAVRATAGTLDVELVIVDNASPNAGAETLQAAHPDARVIARRANDGFAAGVNAGFAASSAPYVLVLNPDAVVQEGAVEAVVAHLDENTEAAVAAPLLYYPDGTLQSNGYRRFPGLLTVFVEFCLPLSHLLHRLNLHPHVLPPRQLHSGGRVEHVYGAALAIRREAYDQVGPLDEGFFLYLEETEWQERVRRAGWTVEVVPGAAVVHAVRGGRPGTEVASPHYYPSLYRYLQLHGRSPRLVGLVIAAASLISLATLGVAGLAARHRAKARSLAAGYRSALAYAARAILRPSRG